MRINKLILGFVLLFLSGSICSAQSKPLRDLAEKRGVYIGTAVAITPLKEEPLYRQTIEREFNIIVAENAFKWGLVQPKKSKFNFKDTDLLVKFAETNKMKLRGHTLVWHRQNPSTLR